MKNWIESDIVSFNAPEGMVYPKCSTCENIDEFAVILLKDTNTFHCQIFYFNEISKLIIMKNLKFTFLNHTYQCDVIKGRYAVNGRILLRLIDSKTGESIATCTTNLPNLDLDKDEVAIKDYSENEGMYDQLFNYGIISKVIRYVNTGYEKVPIVKVLI